MPKGSMSAPSPFSRAIAEEISAQRQRHEVTQEEIAEAIGKSQTYISDRVRSGYLWTTNDLDAMSPLFGMSAFDLVALAEARVEKAGNVTQLRPGVGGFLDDAVQGLDTAAGSDETQADEFD